MKKLLLITIMALSSLSAHAYDAEIDGIYYNFLDDEATVTYRSTAFDSYSGIVVIPESLTYNNKVYSVTGIGVNAFGRCTNLTSVIIPNSVTNIGKYAFYYCGNLASVNIPSSVITISEGVFENCSTLTSITIPNSVISIGSSAFSGCSSLTSVIIPNSVTTIGYLAFSYCSSLTSVTIPEGVTSIGNSTFFSCSSLAFISIPNSVTGIGESAFSNCTSLASIIIPNSITTIGNSAFSGCYFTHDAFVNNSTLNSDNYWGATLCDKETTDGLMIDGNSIKKCRPWAKSVAIPNSVTSISTEAFFGCSILTSITIPNSVTFIGVKAFYKCINLSSVTIPNSVTHIGSSAFNGCKLRNMLIKCTTPPTGGTAFSEQTYYHTTLYIPTGSWETYAYDDNWYKFHNIRETATTEEQISTQQSYTLMDASTFAYSVYDPVNDCIGTISSVSGINEDNPNHSWQMIEVEGNRYLYNIGAKKYVKRSSNGLELTDVPEPIEVEDGDNGIILGTQTSKQWALVNNEHMSVAQSAIDEVTGIVSLLGETEDGAVYNLIGQRIHAPQKGLNIINGRKVLIK